MDYRIYKTHTGYRADDIFGNTIVEARDIGDLFSSLLYHEDETEQDLAFDEAYLEEELAECLL